MIENRTSTPWNSVEVAIGVFGGLTMCELQKESGYDSKQGGGDSDTSGSTRFTGRRELGMNGFYCDRCRRMWFARSEHAVRCPYCCAQGARVGTVTGFGAK